MISIRKSLSGEKQRLFEIWHEAVRATHSFLLEEDFQFYAKIVREEYLNSGLFWVAADEADRAIGWLDLNDGKVEALFVDPAWHRKGVGRALIEHARNLSPQLKMDANEQSGAAEFYRRMGFVEVGRSAKDSRGRPYPLVHMKWSSD